MLVLAEEVGSMNTLPAGEVSFTTGPCRLRGPIGAAGQAWSKTCTALFGLWIGIVYSVTVGSSIWASSAVLAAVPPHTRRAAPESAVPTSSTGTIAAGELVRQALAAEAAGQPDKRTSLLKQALSASPDFAPAHWQLGEVRAKERWLPVQAAADQAAREGAVAEYRERRERCRDTFADHLKLADWCAGKGLGQQERQQLFRVLEINPKQPGLYRRLGVTRYQGHIMSREQVQLLKEHARNSASDIAKSRATFARIYAELRSDKPFRRTDALKRLREIRDPTALAELENVLAHGDVEAVRAAIAALEAMPQQSAADQLVRVAVYARLPFIRREAATALQSRSLFSYVPTMIAALEAPIKFDYRSMYYNGAYGHRLMLYQPGPLSDTAFISSTIPTRSIGESISVEHWSRTVTNTALPDTTAFQDQQTVWQVQNHNEASAKLNQRTLEALSVATGQDLGTSVENWWNWWLDYNEIYRPPIKSVATRQRETHPYGPLIYRRSFCSCFVAGTPVWTSTGQMPIQEIRPGDCVLSQHTDTGELSFKPVLATTVRPPSPLVEIHVGSEIIRATRGHPFWVSGVGWQMAKELKAGQWLHTTSGGKLIDQVEHRGEAPCYNLVVADDHSYFVGNEQILVHDNLLRDVTTATVPGLVAEK